MEKLRAPPDKEKASDDVAASPEARTFSTDLAKDQPVGMEKYQKNAESSNSRGKPYPSRANLRYLAAKLERLAQELHTGKIPTQEELAIDENYQAGRLLGYEMDTNTSVVLAGIVDSLRRVAKHRRAAVRSGGDGDLSPSVYPLVSSALEEVGQS